VALEGRASLWRADLFDFSREIKKKELYQERGAVEKKAGTHK
jgi:hypothetical protein